jgi:hypothetical protein
VVFSAGIEAAAEVTLATAVERGYKVPHAVLLVGE